MKKLISLLLCLVLFLPAAALAEDGWFANAELSEEERNLLTVMMMDEGPRPYDFKAPDGATHLLLTLLKMEDGQWIKDCTLKKELTPQAAAEVTLTARLTEEGEWETSMQQNKSQADGRIYINPADPPNTFGLMIWQPDVPDAKFSNFEAVYLWNEDLVNTFDMACYRRTFLQPEKDRLHQQKVTAALNETVLLNMYVCFFEGGGTPPALSEFNNPEAFSGFDYAFAVTATFTAEQEAD